MDFKTFEKEMVARKDWEVIRVVAYNRNTTSLGQPKWISEIGEFQTNPGPGYYKPFISNGKKIAAFIKNWFNENHLEDALEISFEKVKYN